MAVRDAQQKMALSVSGQNEAPPTLQLRTGTVIAINKAVTPWTVTVRLSDTDFDGITMLGWYDPVVGDPVQVMQQGPALLVMGTLAPGKVYMPASPPPAPPAPPAAPAPPPTIRTVSVSALSAGTAPAEAPYGGWRTDMVYQTGGSLPQRGFYFYGTQIADVKGSGTIIGGKIFIKRSPAVAGVGGGANVRLGWHGHNTQPGGIPGGHSGTTVVGQLLRDQGATFSLPQHMLDAMNAGTAKGFGLEPGAMGYVSADYLIAYGVGAGREWSGQLSLTIRG